MWVTNAAPTADLSNKANCSIQIAIISGWQTLIIVICWTLSWLTSQSPFGVKVAILLHISTAQTDYCNTNRGYLRSYNIWGWHCVGWCASCRQRKIFKRTGVAVTTQHKRKLRVNFYLKITRMKIRYKTAVINKLRIKDEAWRSMFNTRKCNQTTASAYMTVLMSSSHYLYTVSSTVFSPDKGQVNKQKNEVYLLHITSHRGARPNASCTKPACRKTSRTWQRIIFVAV